MSPHDAIAHQTGGNDEYLRDLWRPTAEFLDLLPKTQLLAIAEPIVGAETLEAWSKAKATELPALLAVALGGGGHDVAARNRPAAATWVHPVLQFAPIAPLPTPSKGDL